MKGFNQADIEHWLEEFVESMPLTCSNAEMFNVMCETMRNMSHMHRTFTEEDARAWVAAMNPPAKWTMEQTTDVMFKQGYHHKPFEFWAVMNAMYSDYGKTMVKFNADKPEVYAALTHDWLDDADAEEGKAGRYWRDVVKH